MSPGSEAERRVGRLDGCVALVTGAGRGIGRAHAVLLAERGAAVLVCDVGSDPDGVGRDAGVAERVADEIRSAGGAAEADASDISSFAGGAAAVTRAVDAFGRLDIVVNNAGVGGGTTLDDATEDVLDRVFAVNFRGSVSTVRAAWPHLVESGRGRVVNTVSEVALDTRIAGGGGVAYGPAKAAVWSLTLSLAERGRPHGMTVNAVSPGARTRMNAAMFAEQPPPAELDLDPIHVARVVAFLASDAAGDITGRVIHAAGGQHREYRTERRRDTDLVRRVDEAVSAAGRRSLTPPSRPRACGGRGDGAPPS